MLNRWGMVPFLIHPSSSPNSLSIKRRGIRRGLRVGRGWGEPACSWGSWDPVGSSQPWFLRDVWYWALGRGYFRMQSEYAWILSTLDLEISRKNCTYSKYCACGLYGFHFWGTDRIDSNKNERIWIAELHVAIAPRILQNAFDCLVQIIELCELGHIDGLNPQVMLSCWCCCTLSPSPSGYLREIDPNCHLYSSIVFFLTAWPTLRLTRQWTLPLGRAMCSHAVHRGRRLSGGRSCHRRQPGSRRTAGAPHRRRARPRPAARGESRPATDRRPAQGCT